MNVPFTAEQFFDVFAHYNSAVWPAQYVLLLLGFVVAIQLLVNVRYATIALPVVAFFWLWMALVYFAAFFASINPAARIFAMFFILEALLLICTSVISNAPPAPSWPQRITAAILFTYALVIYPLLGFAQGERYPATITFGLPCPTAIFTFAVFALLAHSLSPAVFVIPVLWAIIGSFAALQLGVAQDFALPIAAAIAIVLALPPHVHIRWKEAT